MSFNDDMERLIQGGGAALPFETIGTVHRGSVVAGEIRNQTDPGTGAVKYFPSGDPMTMLVVTIAKDDGEEGCLYFSGGNFEPAEGAGTSSMTALRAALAKLGKKNLEPGMTIAMQYSGNGKKSNPAHNAPKLYTVELAPAPIGAGLVDQAPAPTQTENPEMIAAPAQPASGGLLGGGEVPAGGGLLG